MGDFMGSSSGCGVECAEKWEIFATRNAMAACLVAISENMCTAL
jgi:hypothetical protein